MAESEVQIIVVQSCSRSPCWHQTPVIQILVLHSFGCFLLNKILIQGKFLHVHTHFLPLPLLLLIFLFFSFMMEWVLFSLLNYLWAKKPSAACFELPKMHIWSFNRVSTALGIVTKKNRSFCGQKNVESSVVNTLQFYVWGKPIEGDFISSHGGQPSSICKSSICKMRCR